ncbi:tetratricopeptide repeat protein [Myxococcota bacterium]|nr:tetratricopeptide repeat protein [Myxococcota bacterium]MBU1533668.1 tetratricopeptide repeat protein [Myxococcota bacterium]
MIHVLLFLILSNPYGDITKNLVDQGNLAIKARQNDRATTIFEAALILAPKNKEVLQRLAGIYLATGLDRQALELYQTMLKDYCTGCTTNCYSKASCTDYQVTVKRISRETIDADRVPLSKSAPKLAKLVFNKAMDFKKKKKYSEARDLLQAAVKLNPDYVGVYRHLGEVYAKLKAPDQADAFYLWYLKVRPAGANSAKVRKMLSKKARKKLGTIRLDSSHSCNIAIGSELLTNARGRPLKTPLKSVTLPTGRYAVGFICQKQNLARRFFVDVTQGKTSYLKFSFGTVSVNLKPWARILIAPKTGARKGRYMDAGLFDVIGLPEGGYTLKLVAFNKTKTSIRDITITGKKHIKITTWEPKPNKKVRKKRSKNRRRKR